MSSFVPILDFENDYEILNEYPYTIRRKNDKYEIKEYYDNNGYVRIVLNQRKYLMILEVIVEKIGFVHQVIKRVFISLLFIR